MNTPLKLTTAELDVQLTQPTVTASPEAAALRSTLADLRASSMAGADFRLIAPKLDARPSPALLFPRWAMVAATAAMAIALAVPVALRTSHPTTPASVAAPQQKIADNTLQDDALLAEIQSDLSTSVPASLAPLATSSTTSTK